MANNELNAKWPNAILLSDTKASRERYDTKAAAQRLLTLLSTKQTKEKAAK